MKQLRILFQGDSITDAGRDKRNFRDMGKGYPSYAAKYLREMHPDTEFDFINLGISGNRTDQLFDRLYPDAIALEPDIISILIGVNDVWHRYGSSRIATTDEQFEVNYRTILQNLRAKTNAKIVMLCPFLLDCDDKDAIREDLKPVVAIVRRLAEEYADVFIPLDEHFAEALKTQPEPKHFSGDGVHPNANGSEFIGRIYAEALAPLLD